MTKIYNDIQNAANENKKLLAVLIDPDKMKPKKVSSFMEKLNTSIATHIFVGGSSVQDNMTNRLVLEIKKHTNLPIILFPGDITQITPNADALLFLSLISGKNPEYLIGKHIASIPKIRETNLEIIPTGYILIESGHATAVERVTQTKPLSKDNSELIVNTAKAGELLGMKLIYLEAGSGAKTPVSKTIIKQVKKELNIPIIVGGGIRNIQELKNSYISGADLIVIGTAFEENELFFDEFQKLNLSL